MTRKKATDEAKGEAAMAWSMRDIRYMRDQLDDWWLRNRPPYRDRASRQLAESKAREMLAAHRKDIVLAGLRSERERFAERYNQKCQTIGNQIVRFTEYGKPDDLIDLFTKLAREDDARRALAEDMVLRVVGEGLPTEVIAWDPIERCEVAR
jgi:hypothetical protein